METSAPEITIDATIGQIVGPSATPSSTSAPTSSPTATPIGQTPTPTPLYPFPTVTPTKNYAQKALTIYGYGPVNSEVTLRGFGVSEKTVSDDKGYFKFTSIYSFTNTYPELCLQSVDSEKRVTQPSCIPALPNNSLIPLEVGPILLSPTISVSENKVKEGANAVLTGKTTPNTRVNIYIAKREGLTNKLSFVNEVNAYTLPVVDTKTNERGEYQISLPTGESADYKIFASSKFGEDFSAKSTTLTFSVLTQIKTIFQRLLDLLLQNKMLLVLMLEVLIFVILFLLALKQTTKKIKKHTEGDYLKFIKG